jgi:hypothetical protein
MSVFQRIVAAFRCPRCGQLTESAEVNFYGLDSWPTKDLAIGDDWLLDHGGRLADDVHRRGDAWVLCPNCRSDSMVTVIISMGKVAGIELDRARAPMHHDAMFAFPIACLRCGRVHDLRIALFARVVAFDGDEPIIPTLTVGDRYVPGPGYQVLGRAISIRGSVTCTSPAAERGGAIAPSEFYVRAYVQDNVIADVAVDERQDLWPTVDSDPPPVIRGEIPRQT